jgi:hypothetical protein
MAVEQNRDYFTVDREKTLGPQFEPVGDRGSSNPINPQKDVN